MFDIFTNPDAIVSLATLTAMEIVLGIDNIVFISILVEKLPPAQRELGRRLGLAGALVMRLGLLFGISWIAGLTVPLFTILNFNVTGRACILILGGLFLLFKATKEIHEKIESHAEHLNADLVAPAVGARVSKFSAVVLQIMILDLVFSIDSVITAVGMSSDISIMVLANILAMGVMLMAGRPVGEFIAKHATFKLLALSFLLMIGAMLVAEGSGFHIPKGYVYFAMAFSIFVEVLNSTFRKKASK